MTGKTGCAVVLAAVSVWLGGCTTCHHKAIERSFCPAACPDTCVAQRNRVHVFLVGGVDPLDDGGLRGLRDAVNVAGFSQVYLGHLHNCGWFAREIRRIACDDPDARFVVVGYGASASSAAALAAEARRHGLHTDGLVLLDPTKVSVTDFAAIEAQVLVVGSDRWVPLPDLAGCDMVRLPDVCHFAVATDPLTVERTVALLRDAVARVPEAIPPATLPMIDDPAPLPAVIPDRATNPKARPAVGDLVSRPAKR